MRKVLRANADLAGRFVAPATDPALFALFRDYIHARHDGALAAIAADPRVFHSFVTTTCAATALFELREPDGRLVGACVVDHIAEEGLVAAYSFFAVETARRSLGTLIILRLIEATRRLGEPHLHLGTLVPAAKALAYKTRFRPSRRSGPAAGRHTAPKSTATASPRRTSPSSSARSPARRSARGCRPRAAPQRRSRPHHVACIVSGVISAQAPSANRSRSSGAPEWARTRGRPLCGTGAWPAPQLHPLGRGRPAILLADLMMP
ncbi:MAG: hypothetical protein HQL40_05900 [Alphaproteobacteria bacterium]|nr:hypothetical protein [Alphaproteobacteria bacterium]